MDALAKHIDERLEKKPYCMVFEGELAQEFPVPAKDTKALSTALTAFAKKRGWTVQITNPGIRATFRKIKT